MVALTGPADAVPGDTAIRLLGGFTLDGCGLDSARAESLVTYLVLHAGEPHDRGRLAALLWPDSTGAQARTNLRHLLHTLRRRLPAAAERLETTARTVRWRPDPAVPAGRDRLRAAARRRA